MASLRSPIQRMQQREVDALLANPVMRAVAARRNIEPYQRLVSANAFGPWRTRPIGAYIPARPDLRGVGAYVPARAGLAGGIQSSGEPYAYLVNRSNAAGSRQRRPVDGLGRLQGFGRFGRFGASTAVTGAQGVASGVSTGLTATALATGTTASAVAAGAMAGSVVPIIGTAIGAIVGLIASGVLDHKADPEVANFNQAMAIYKQNRLAVLNIANKYLVLAGLFDLTPSQIKGNIPIYRKYGRMGEFRFVTDMVGVINAAAQAGRITAHDTPQTVMANIVQPWIDSFGFGPMVDFNADMINLILLGMVTEYLAGGHTRWYAVGGDFPFGNLPKFTLPQVPAVTLPPLPGAPAAQAVTGPAPSPATQPSPAAQPYPVQPLPTYRVPIPGTPAAPVTALDPALAAAVQQMLSQGASQQQAFQAALQSLQAQGVQPTAPVQQAIASDVRALAQPVTAGISGLPDWLTYAGVGAGVLVLIFSLARPHPGKAR